MLVLPMRSPQYLRGPRNQDGDPHTKLLQEHHIPDHRPTLTLHQQSTVAMLSVMATPIPGPKRPKLSLQTSNVSPLPATHRSKTAVSLSVVTPSPTAENTQANTFHTPPDTNMARDAVRRPTDPRSLEFISPSPSRSSATTSSSGHTSPCFPTIPYCLPMGAHSILRNSPLPRRATTSTIPRTAKVLFPPVKSVCFHEQLEEVIPPPITYETADTSNVSDTDTCDKRLEYEIAERKALDDLLEKEENSTGSIDRRRRRRRKRDWIWRPLEDDIQRDIMHSKKPAVDDMRHSWHASELKREKTAPEISLWCREQPVGGKALGLLGVENWSLQIERHP